MDAIGTFERNIGGRFIYKLDPQDPHRHVVYHAQTMKIICWLPRSFNIWQNSGQLQIWFLAKGL